jgi:hypothetical protein
MSKSVGTLILWLAAVAANAAPLPGFVLTAQTPHVSFFSRGERVDTQRVEKRVVELQTLFGQPLTQRANYYRYATAQEVAAGTGHYAAGVTFAATGEVHSTEAFHDHELVHLVAGQLGDPGAFFQEGLAVAVGNGGKWQGRSADRIAKGSTASVTAMVASFDRFDANEAYAVAGSFVGYLIKTEGMAKLTAFFRACGPKVDAKAAFAQSFGRTLETAAAEWQEAL